MHTGVDTSAFSNDYPKLTALQKLAVEYFGTRNKWAHLVTDSSLPSLAKPFAIACEMLRISPPKLILVDDPNVNSALFMGTTILISTGLIKTLNDEEAKFVINHEAAHKALLTRRDLLRVAAVAYVSDYLDRKNPLNLKDNAQSAYSTTITMLALLYVLRMKHNAEYDADRLSLEINKNPEAAINALQKMDDILAEERRANDAKMEDRIRSSFGEFGAKQFHELLVKLDSLGAKLICFSDHPSTQDRIKAINTYAANKNPNIQKH